jgi:hypothetical protein
VLYVCGCALIRFQKIAGSRLHGKPGWRNADTLIGVDVLFWILTFLMVMKLNLLAYALGILFFTRI